MNVAGKVVLISGGGTGIGAACARSFAEAGAQVVVTGRRRELIDSVAAEVGGLALVADAARATDMRGVIDLVTSRFGGLDVLIANAGGHGLGAALETDDRSWNQACEANLGTAFVSARESLPSLVRRRGSIIIVSSIGGLKGTSALGAYAISKAADMQLARNLAVEWGKQNIRINCIAPGLVKTDFARALWENPKVLTHYESLTPLGRIGEPDDIGGIAVFLASRAGAFVTGQTIVADGGVTIAS